MLFKRRNINFDLLFQLRLLLRVIQRRWTESRFFTDGNIQLFTVSENGYGWKPYFAIKLWPPSANHEWNRNQIWWNPLDIVFWNVHMLPKGVTYSLHPNVSVNCQCNDGMKICNCLLQMCLFHSVHQLPSPNSYSCCPCKDLSLKNNKDVMWRFHRFDKISDL